MAEPPATPARPRGRPAAAPGPAAKPAAKPRPAWQRALASFWGGFSEPSALAFGTFCASLLATLGLCLWFFSETTLAGPAGRFLPRSGLDAEGFATREALRTGHAAPVRPRLLVLGTSAVAQAVGAGGPLHDRLQALTGQDWEVVILTTPLQAPTDQFALIDRALDSQTAGSPPAVVALGVGLQRLRWTGARGLEFAAAPRLGLRSDWEDDEIRALGGTPRPRTGLYPLDNRGFLLVNGAEALLRLALRLPARRLVDQYARGGLSDATRQEARDRMGAEIRTGAAAQAAYLAQIGRLAARVGAVPGVQLVLVEEPLSPGLVTDQHLAAEQAALRAAFGTDPATRALPFWPVAAEAGLAESDYFDDLHIRRGDAQQKVQAALADHVPGVADGN
jgi:hypothetical protein